MENEIVYNNFILFIEGLQVLELNQTCEYFVLDDYGVFSRIESTETNLFPFLF